MAYSFVDRYSGNVIVAPCLVSLLGEVKVEVDAGRLDVENAGEIGNLAHKLKGWTASDHNPFVQHNGMAYVRAADFSGKDYPKLVEFLNFMYARKDPRVYPFGYSNSDLPAPRGLTIWFGNGATRDGTDGNHAHLSMTQRDGNNASASGWVPALDDTSPWGFGDWLRGGGTPLAPHEEVQDLPFTNRELAQIVNDAVIGVLRGSEAQKIIHDQAQLAVRQLLAGPGTEGFDRVTQATQKGNDQS